jgi:hypothetical protein
MTDNHLLLYRLAELMLEHEQHILPVDFLFDDDKIGDFVKSIQIDSPYQQMLLEGVLTESVKDEKLFVSFTVEGYFHYLLGEVIYNKTKGLAADALKQIVEENKLNGAKEGVEQCLIIDVHKADLTRLIWLIDESDKSLELAVAPLANALLSRAVGEVLNKLMINPSFHDLIVLGRVLSLFDSNLKTSFSAEINKRLKDIDNIDALIIHEFNTQNLIEVKNKLKIIEDLGLINERIEAHLKNKFRVIISSFIKTKNKLNIETIELVNFLVKLKDLDKANKFYTQFIKEAEKRNDQDLLVVALEHFGDSEYKRSGQDGYRAAIDALTRAVAIRETAATPKKDKLKNTYRLLGFAYLWLGLQVTKSLEYFEKAKAIMLEESSDSIELAEINLYIGLANFWRGLRGIGRWGNKDESLLNDLIHDPFVSAVNHYEMAIEIRSRLNGKIHPETIKLYHHLQEASYSLGKYELAITSLKKYVSIIPYKDKEHTDNFYLYSLIVSLEESAKRIASSDKAKALALIQEAVAYTKNYDENNQITKRLSEVKKQIEEEDIIELHYSSTDKLAPLDEEKNFKGVWGKWDFSEQLKGFQTNNWLSDHHGIWFFNRDKKQLVYWNRINNSITEYNPSNWPDGIERLVFDPKNQIFYTWYSIRSTVYELTSPEGNWSRLTYGLDDIGGDYDVHAFGASYAFDSVNNRLIEFGGYGYFTYKNWLWAYEITERKWIQLKENKPGISPYPRNGQLLPIKSGTKAILVSGIGSDTGIQREHKVRMGLASATDVGYFTWLRDAHELDLATMNWREKLSANHGTIRHEGAMGFVNKLNLIVNWAGILPSPTYGVEAEKQSLLSTWQLSSTGGFKNLSFKGDLPPFTEGSFVSITNSNYLLYIHSEGIWKLTINDL